jgi:transposase
MGVLPTFGGVAVHDAWAPYDSYTAAGHQLCCAHARRELQAITDLAAEGEWCWATQAADALTAMQKLVSEAISQDREVADPAALDAQIHAYRSAALIGASQTTARSTALMRKQHALARRLLNRQDDYLRFTRDFRVSPDNDLASHCTSWVRSAASGFSRWSGRVAGVVLSIACGTDIFRQRAAEVGVVAAS